MAYTGFPATYQQYYPQYSQMSPTPMSGTSPQQNNPFIWIQGGIAGAQSYQVAPNNTVILWDSDEQSIYIKSADMQGKPSIKILDYTIRSEAPKTAQNALAGNNVDIPTRDDIKALQGQIDALKQQIGAMCNESTLSADATTARKQPSAKVSAVQTAVSG